MSSPLGRGDFKQQHAPAPKHGANVEAGQIGDVVGVKVGHKHLQGHIMSKALLSQQHGTPVSKVTRRGIGSFAEENVAVWGWLQWGEVRLDDQWSAAQLYQARQVQVQNSSGLTFVKSACGIPLVTRFT